MDKIWKWFRSLFRSASASTTESVIGKTNRNLIAFTTVCLFILWIVSYKQVGDSRIWNLFLIAMGSAAAGAMFGFAFASFGKERDDLKPMFAAVNGLLSGAAITDLSKGSTSLIRSFIWSLAKASGLSDGIAIISMVILAFASLGFLALYYNRKLLLNIESAAADNQLESLTDEDAAGDRLRRFWKPRGVPNAANTFRLEEWKKANGLAKISLTFFVRSEAYADARKRAVKDLGLRMR